MRELKSKKEIKKNFLNIFLLLFHKYKKTIHKLLLITSIRFTLIKKLSINLGKPLWEKFKIISD